MFGQKGLPAIGSRQRQVQAGQILLIVVLVIIVASTVGLSLATRSIISLRTSTEEAESQKALSAAEAGIERAIQGSIPVEIRREGNISIGVGDNLVNNSSYVTQFTQVQSSSFLINGGNVIPQDEGTDVWFVNHNPDGTPDYSSALSPNFLNLYWGSSDENCDSSNAPAAIQAIVVSRNTSTDIKTYRYAYDSCPNRRSENNFTRLNPADVGSFPIDYDGDGTTDITFKNRTPENNLAQGIGNIVFMRVIPIYKDAVIGIYACNNGGGNCTSLPSQGYVISSTGTSGQANRKITVFKGYQQAYLPYLSYGLFVAN